MKTQATLVMLLSASTALSALGCGAAPTDSKIEEQEQALWSGYHGGPGGYIYSDKLSTTENYSGYDLRCSDAGVENIKLETKYGCDSRWRGGFGSGLGGLGGEDQGWVSCPRGQYIVGIYGKSGTYLDQLGFYCGNVDHSVVTQMAACGVQGGPDWTDLCPPGQIMKNYWIHAGDWIDGIQINCGVPNNICIG